MSSFMVDEATQKIQVIKKNLKKTQERQKSIADGHARLIKCNVGDLVFLRLSPWKGMVRFGKQGKFSPWYNGLYYIIQRVGNVA